MLLQCQSDGTLLAWDAVSGRELFTTDGLEDYTSRTPSLCLLDGLVHQQQEQHAHDATSISTNAVLLCNGSRIVSLLPVNDASTTMDPVTDWTDVFVDSHCVSISHSQLAGRKRCLGAVATPTILPTTVKTPTHDISEENADVHKQSKMTPVSKVGENEDDPPSCQEDVICLNVSDTIMHVKRGTLTTGGGLLAAMFSGRWQLKTVDSNGVLFLDHRPEVFKLLLDCLRERAIESSPHYRAMLPIIPEHLLRSFHQLVEYYGLTNYLYETCIVSKYASLSGERPTGGPSGHPLVVIPPMTLTWEKWYQGFFVQNIHNRQLKVLHLTFGETCRKLEIGWAKLSGGLQNDKKYQDDRVAVVFEHGSTTARIVRTNSIERKGQPPFPPRELSTFPFAHDDTPRKISLHCHGYGHRCHIIVNGECVVDTKSLIELQSYPEQSSPESWTRKVGYLVPFIGLEGTASVAGIELD